MNDVNCDNVCLNKNNYHIEVVEAINKKLLQHSVRQSVKSFCFIWFSNRYNDDLLIIGENFYYVNVTAESI